MTEQQRLRGLGIDVALNLRGVALTTGTPPVTVVALVEPIVPSDEDHTFAPYEREASRLAIRREHLPSSVAIGSVFVDAASGTTHRVTEIFDHPTDLLVRLACETAPQSP